MRSSNNDTNLWKSNTAQAFWMCQPCLPEECWQDAIRNALPIFNLPGIPEDPSGLAEFILGEKYFGGSEALSPSRRLYYRIKPFLPRVVINQLKKSNANEAQKKSPLNWPVEDRYARFLWEVIRQVLILTNQGSISYRRFWPENFSSALVLTHDVETGEGQKFVEQVANLDEQYGFRSSFNFVPERYPLDWVLIKSLRERGFEIGVHGLQHDGKLFLSKNGFLQRAKRINQYIKKFEAAGFRSPLMHRNAYWMQALDVEYDLSFFDTDPFEPQPGGCMSIWPYRIGRFIELPYTLVQDSTLYHVLGERSPRIWLEKLDFVKQYQGMALLNTHPDYLANPHLVHIYETFLAEVRSSNKYWNPLPQEAARWWDSRTEAGMKDSRPERNTGQIVLTGDQIILT